MGYFRGKIADANFLVPIPLQMAKSTIFFKIYRAFVVCPSAPKYALMLIPNSSDFRT